METEKLFSSYSKFESWIINNKEKVSSYVMKNDVYLSDIMSARAYNVMRINQIQKMSDIIFISFDEISGFYMMDKNVLNEVLMFKRNFLRKNKRDIIMFISGNNDGKRKNPQR